LTTLPMLVTPLVHGGARASASVSLDRVSKLGADLAAQQKPTANSFADGRFNGMASPPLEGCHTPIVDAVPTLTGSDNRASIRRIATRKAATQGAQRERHQEPA
jgi:hypothetical protein